MLGLSPWFQLCLKVAERRVRIFNHTLPAISFPPSALVRKEIIRTGENISKLYI